MNERAMFSQLNLNVWHQQRRASISKIFRNILSEILKESKNLETSPNCSEFSVCNFCSHHWSAILSRHCYFADILANVLLHSQITHNLINPSMLSFLEDVRNMDLMTIKYGVLVEFHSNLIWETIMTTDHCWDFIPSLSTETIAILMIVIQQ